MNCLFCKIAAKKIPAEIVAETDRTVAFLDIEPRALGHTVIIPKHHADTLLTLPTEEIGPLFAAVQAVAGRIVRALRPAGFTIGINHGAVSGQTVPHLHVHIIPRFADDGGGSVHSVVHRPPVEPIAVTAERLRNA